MELSRGIELTLEKFLRRLCSDAGACILETGGGIRNFPGWKNSQQRPGTKELSAAFRGNTSVKVFSPNNLRNNLPKFSDF